MTDFWFEFTTIAFVHLLAVASPGPDFAVVLKVALTQPRRIALYTSAGIGVGILIHVVYSLLGINILFKTFPWLYQSLLWCCAAYLFYIGVKALQTTKRTVQVEQQNDTQKSVSTMSALAGFKLGFITNGLNPKASLFFLSLFTVVIAPDTPVLIKSLYGVYLATATGLWFCLLSFLLTQATIQQKIQGYAHWIDRVMGGILILIALSLVIN
jgi:threonine/homoserine/homoserine lactone efflux protein